MQKTLDLSIKKYETGKIEGGYTSKNGKTYESYMTVCEWSSFKENMEKNHQTAFENYDQGSGGELKEKGNYPPKMASYGSSSRMIYNLCKEIDDFQFEYKLPTQIGGIANLDGFIENEEKFVFIEAKCRELYGVKSHMIEKKYKELYEYINNADACNLKIITTDADEKMNVKFTIDDLEVSSFDIKQMICHLLGIAVKFLENPTDKKISFLYLCYNPGFIEIINDKKKLNILTTYEKMCKECKTIDFDGLFEVIVRYLSLELNIGNSTDNEISSMCENFEFTLCDQNDFLSYLKK